MCTLAPHVTRGGGAGVHGDVLRPQTLYESVKLATRVSVSFITHEAQVCMEMFFGFLGLWNLVIAGPLLLLFDHFGIETLSTLSPASFYSGYIIYYKTL